MARADGMPDSTSTPPLGEYFWIAGVDTLQLLNALGSNTTKRWSYETTQQLNSQGPHPTSGVIQEDLLAEEASEETGTSSIPPLSRPHNNNASRLHASNYSPDEQRSPYSFGSSGHSTSNRSSITMRPTPTDMKPTLPSPNHTDFDKAVKNFTHDRDAFRLDLNLDVDKTSPTAHSGSKSRAQKIVADDFDIQPNKPFGSVRRHMSFRDMASARRQASVARHFSTRTARRLSSYNAVIPLPEVLKSTRNQHPLKRKFEPVMLDRFPRSDMHDALKNRTAFPDYVPMFAFPDDVVIRPSDVRPKSTWHEFSMTAADNSRVTAVCIIIWIPLNKKMAIEIEQKCEEWRQLNMTDAERELAMSLTERLADERAQLSHLLTQLPDAPSGSARRDQLDEDIGAVEERINVVSEMLKPLSYGALSHTNGFAEGDTELWIPRAYGVLGKDGAMSNFWRQWLRAVVVPMTNGAVQRVPASSPKVGMWQPLETYVFTLCMQAPAVTASKTQIDVAIRELHLFAKKEALNELPGCRTSDLYPLFRALTISNIVLLMEYVLAESRIILLSSHTSMLQLVSRALIELIWPLKWSGIYIPVLPSRLVQALEAPCPYICGILRSYEKYDLPEDDFVIVDLDKNEIHSTALPPALPKRNRRKLLALLYVAAPLHHSSGVSPGPPAYAVETFPGDAFAVENETTFTAVTKSTNLTKLVTISSALFGPQAVADTIQRGPCMNAFLAAQPARGKSADPPLTGSTVRHPDQPDTDFSHQFSYAGQQLPQSPFTRHNSGYTLQTSLRDKKSSLFDRDSRRSESISGRLKRKSSIPFVRHASSPSTISMAPNGTNGTNGTSNYASSTYAQSTLAASTIMPGIVIHPAHNDETTTWVEGHCFQWRPDDGPSTCVICEEKVSDGYSRCSGCGIVVHPRCAEQVTVVCPTAFYPDQVRAAFVRCLAGLFATYRKFMQPARIDPDTGETLQKFNFDRYVKSLSSDNAEYIQMLRQTQAFSEFIADREQNDPSVGASVALFDAIIAAKGHRASRLSSRFFGLSVNKQRHPSRSPTSISNTGILDDSSLHQWKIVTVRGPTGRLDSDTAAKGRDYYSLVTRTPAKLEDEFLQSREEIPKMPEYRNGNVTKGRLPTIQTHGLNANASR